MKIWPKHVPHELMQSQEMNLHQMDDEKIWLLFTSGHEGAFALIYEKYVQLLYNYGIRFYGDREIIKDCIQELFIDLRVRSKFNKVVRIKPYLYGALRKKIFSVLRKNKISNSIIDSYMDVQFDVEISHEHKLINSLYDTELKEKLRKAISKLNNNQKEILHYFYYEDYTYQEIAAIMNFRHVRSVRNLIYKVIKQLRNSID